MSEELKAIDCPFCGGSATLTRMLNVDKLEVEHKEGCYIYGYGANDWHFHGQIHPVEAVPEILLTWNRRTTPAEQWNHLAGCHIQGENMSSETMESLAVCVDAARKQFATPAPLVDEAMIERACQTFYGMRDWEIRIDCGRGRIDRQEMRCALLAALGQPVSAAYKSNAQEILDGSRREAEMRHILDMYREVAEEASAQWGEDYLWEKWGLNERMASAGKLLAELDGAAEREGGKS